MDARQFRLVMRALLAILYLMRFVVGENSKSAIMKYEELAIDFKLWMAGKDF